MVTRATREGVHEQDPVAGIKQPTDVAADTPREPTERELAMQAIEDANLKRLEEESGIKFTDETPADEKPAAVAEVTEDPAPVVADAAKQAAAQTEGDEIIITAENIGRVKFATKIDGVEEFAPAAKVVANYQKGGTADVRLAEATRLRAEAQKSLDDAKKAPPATAPAAQEVVTDATPTKKTVSSEAITAKFEAAAQALYEGDAKKYATLQSEAIAEQTQLATAGRSDPATRQAVPDAASIAQEVKQQLSQDSALVQLDKDYPGLRADPDLSLITNRYIAAIRENDPSVTLGDAITRAADQVGEKFKLGKYAAAAGRPVTSGAAPTTKEQKLEGKGKIDGIPSNDARATAEVEKVLTPSEEIELMRKSRPGAA